jgi:uncharacterized protein (TIGR02391 family)
MHWDDLEILRTVDDAEQTERVSLTNGLELMQRISRARGETPDYNRDYPTFVHELLLAQHHGYLIFDDTMVYPQMGDPRVGANANSWLQSIRDLRLTLDGRDRARGQVILRPLPSPDEDDDRPIAGMTLDAIARAIGDTYTDNQLIRFLDDSGIPEEVLSELGAASRWQYVLSVFELLHDGGSESRRALRGFIGAWLDNRLHTGPDVPLHEQLLVDLARQGWFVVDSQLVIGQPQFRNAPVAPPFGTDARLALLHPAIREAASRYLDTHLEVAIFEAFKAVDLRVRELSGIDAFGTELMGKAFGTENPPLKLADLTTETGKGIQEGFRFIFMGAVRGIRNRDAHELFRPLDDEDAIEQLSLASMLMRRLDGLAAGAD